MKYVGTYNINNGDTQIKIHDNDYPNTVASVQLQTDAAFDGTTSTAKFIQSNNIDAPFSEWHDLPETPLVIKPGKDSNLLQTKSFTCKHIAIALTQGDATDGVYTFNHKFKAK